MKVYLDYSATTPLDKDVFSEMAPYFCERYGNADSVHSFGRDAAYATDKARRQIAVSIGAQPKEIFFTSGGTESDNWAIKGLAKANAEKGKRIVVSAIEHAAVLSPAQEMSLEGYDVVFLPVQKNGIVSPLQLENALKAAGTALVSIMTANNEIGSVQPVKQLAEISHKYGAVFHTDAVQAVGNIPVNVKDCGVDAMTLSAHKFYGPKGIGALYLKSGVKIDRLISGGHQEKSRRGGTTPVALVVGMGAAIEKAVKDLDENTAKVRVLRDRFAEKITEALPDIIYNGDKKSKLAQIANFTFPAVEGDAMVMALDLQGVACSSGAACSSGSLEPSHVMKALGYDDDYARRSVRFSFGKFLSAQEVDYCADKVIEVYKNLSKVTSLIADAPQKKHMV